MTQHNGELASDLAVLCHKVALIMDATRKMEAHEARSMDYTPATLLEFFRSKQSPAQRAQWIQDLTAMNERRSVLG